MTLKQYLEDVSSADIWAFVAYISDEGIVPWELEVYLSEPGDRVECLSVLAEVLWDRLRAYEDSASEPSTDFYEGFI